MANTTKRPRRDSSSGTSNSSTTESSDETDSQKILPQSLSFWSRRDILDLKITPRFRPFKSPMDIVDMLNPISQVTQKMLSLRQRARNISAVLKRKCVAFAYILDKELGSLSTNTTYDILTESRLWAIKDFGEQNESEWGNRFQMCGEDFSRWLHDIVQQLEDDHGADISEYMFQFLFDSFASLFGLKSRPSPCIQLQSMEIKDSIVSGYPDLLYKRTPSPLAQGSKHCTTVMVCEVKKCFDVKEELLPQKLRKSSVTQETPTVTSTEEDVSSKQSQLSPHISDGLLGQHCGELLLYYPFSIREHMILGMIIQKTNVTFTALCLSRDQFESLKNGTLKLDRQTGPEFLYTKPYNYLLKAEREQLIEPLVFLGFLQSDDV